MAIKALATMVRTFPPPVYCYHEIVHNQEVVRRFEEQGVVFVDSIDEVPQGSPIMLSAHGSAPDVVADAETNRQLHRELGVPRWSPRCTMRFGFASARVSGSSTSATKATKKL